MVLGVTSQGKGEFVKFIHAADIHLDSPMHGLTAYQGAPTERLRGATREAFRNLIDLAIEEVVDFIIIAGDLYDGTWKDYNTGQYFCVQMGRLHKAGIPAYVVFGNHDAESEMTKQLVWPPNVKIFSSRHPQVYKIPGLKVALHGQSFRERAVTDNLAVNYQPAVPGWFNIGVLHTALEGSAAHANYAPCTLQELAAKQYDYWALGHVHEYAVHSRNPWVVFPGNLQGRNIRETGPRGAVMVTVDGDHITSVERIFLDVLRWHRLDVDLSELTDWAGAVNKIGGTLEDALARLSTGRPMAIRVCLSGKTSLHGELFGRENQIREEVCARAASIDADGLWVEKVDIATTPALSAEAIAKRSDAVADLQKILATASEDNELLKDIQLELQALVNLLPHEIAADVAFATEVRTGSLKSLVEKLSPTLITALIAGEGI